MDRPREGMAGLAKGLAVIEAFGAHPRLTVAEAARAVDLTRAATRRCLMTLVELGYLHHDGKYFTPQPRLLRLGFAYLSGATLAQRAQPALDGLRDATGESASIAILDGELEVVFIARATAPRLVAAGVSLGARLPVCGSATGRTLLATRSDEAVLALARSAPLERRTDKTLVDPAAILASVQHARNDRYCIDDEELEIGLRAVAVPVCNARGETVAAMSLSTSSARMTVEAMVEFLVPLLERAADEVGAAL